MDGEETIKAYKKGNKEFRIINDNLPLEPRKEMDNLGIIHYRHRNYILGDEKISDNFEGSFKEYLDYLKKELKALVILPIYLYDHSGITISTKPFNCPWDSSEVGYIFTTKEKIKEFYPEFNLSKKFLEEIKQNLISEITQFDYYLKGECYGYELLTHKKCKECGHTEEDLKDSCYGFYGPIDTSGILENLPKGFKEVD